MATLIAVYNSDGCVGRCDAKCHEAASPACECDCICGGRNHGVGEKKAVENTQQYCEEMIDQWKQKHNDPDQSFQITKDVSQFKLF
jgi:hypothetical protein